jgi:hypothetical protein
MLSMLEHMSGLSIAGFTRYLGMDRTEVEVFLTQVRKEWKKKGMHGYWPL